VKVRKSVKVGERVRVEMGKREKKGGWWR